MVIGVQNQLPITFGKALVYNKMLKVRNSLPPHILKIPTFDIFLRFYSEPKKIRMKLVF